jgi:ribosomal protein S18 acetylase RimI-like enzyme
VEIRRLLESDAQEFRNLRLEALEREPSSFAESADEMRHVNVEIYAQRLRNNTNDSFVVGAFHDSKLVGIAGFFREARLKRRHKGTVWGVYVSPDHRGQGIARAILTEVLKTARTIPDLKWIALSVTVEREPARRLYRSLGFQPWGIESQALKVGDAYFDEEFMALEVDVSESKP